MLEPVNQGFRYLFVLSGNSKPAFPRALSIHCS